MAANCRVQQCVFVVSFPRSGTHLLIDFIRRNYPIFNPKLKIWHSASNLYLNIDNGDWLDCAKTFLQARRSHVIVKTHQAGFTHQNDILVRELFNPQRVIYLYPFRRFSTTVKSFAEFMQSPPPVSATLQQGDLFFRQEGMVSDCIRYHAKTWLARGARFIDSDQLLEDPEATCRPLSELFEQPPQKIQRRLPRHKAFAGKAGELLGRLLGRESTELVIRHKLAWTCASERIQVDNHFSDLHAELSGHRIN